MAKRFWADMPNKSPLLGADVLMIGDSTDILNPKSATIDQVLNKNTISQSYFSWIGQTTTTNYICFMNLMRGSVCMNLQVTDSSTNITTSYQTIFIYEANVGFVIKQLQPIPNFNFYYDNTSGAVYITNNTATLPTITNISFTMTLTPLNANTSFTNGTDVNITAPASSVVPTVIMIQNNEAINLVGTGGVVANNGALSVENTQALQRYFGGYFGINGREWLNINPNELSLYSASNTAIRNLLLQVQPTNTTINGTAYTVNIDAVTGATVSVLGNSLNVGSGSTTSSGTIISGANQVSFGNALNSWQIFTSGNKPFLSYIDNAGNITNIPINDTTNALLGITAGNYVTIDTTNPNVPVVNGANIQAGNNMNVVYDNVNNIFTLNSQAGAGNYSVMELLYSNNKVFFNWNNDLKQNNLGQQFTVSSTSTDNNYLAGVSTNTVLVFTDISVVAICSNYDTTSLNYTFIIVGQNDKPNMYIDNSTNPFNLSNTMSPSATPGQYISIGNSFFNSYILTADSVQLGSDNTFANNPFKNGDLIYDRFGNILRYNNSLPIGTFVLLQRSSGAISGTASNLVMINSNGNGIVDSTMPLAKVESIDNKVDLTTATTTNQYPTALSVKSYVDNKVASVGGGGLQVPTSLQLESQLPNPTTQTVGTYVLIQNMDVTSPGKQGQAWINYTNPSDTTTPLIWYKIVDSEASPDGVTIVYNGSNELSVATSITNQITQNTTDITTLKGQSFAAQFIATFGFVLKNINVNQTTGVITGSYYPQTTTYPTTYRVYNPNLAANTSIAGTGSFNNTTRVFTFTPSVANTVLTAPWIIELS